MANSGGSRVGGARKRKEPSPIERMAEERRHRINAAYAAHHPQRAAEERALRVAQAAAADRYGHRRNGTVETHAAAANVRQGALARLHRSGAISNDQLGWALEIQAEHERIDADVAVRSASLETRVDRSRSGDGGLVESVWAVRRAVAYTRWRAALPSICEGCPTGAAHLLAMVVDDMGVTWAAKRLRMGVRRTRKVLVDALDLWPVLLQEARAAIEISDF